MSTTIDTFDNDLGGENDNAWKRTAKIYEDAISSETLGRNDKIALWSRYILFLDSESNDLAMLSEMRKQRKMYKESGRSSFLLSKKRAREAAEGVNAGETNIALSPIEKKVVKLEKDSALKSKPSTFTFEQTGADAAKDTPSQNIEATSDAFAIMP